MAIDFPGSPSNGQRHSHNNTTWEWDGSSWNRITIDLSTTDATTVVGLAVTQFARRDDDNIITGVTTFIGNGYTGVGNTVLTVEGDARVTGVLSIGQGSVSINERDISAVGVITGSNFKTGTTNVHNVGVEVAGINVLGADTPIGTGATVYNSGLIVSKAGAEYQGVVTATTFKGAVQGNVTGNVTGNVSGSAGSASGNAATATALQNARTIGGVSFDGTSNINLPGVNQAGNQNTTGTAALAEGLTGIPDITVRNVTVTGIQTAEDVKNIDSIGIITARAGINVTANTDTDTLNVSGITTFGGNIDANGDLDVDGITNLDDVNIAGVTTFGSNVTISSGTLKVDSQVGAAGSVLSSTSSGLEWVSPLTGPQGAQGRQGAAGVVGAQGAQGVQGTAGSRGGTGPQGVQGAQGHQGHQGRQGTAGTDGTIQIVPTSNTPNPLYYYAEGVPSTVGQTSYSSGVQIVQDPIFTEIFLYDVDGTWITGDTFSIGTASQTVGTVTGGKYGHVAKFSGSDLYVTLGAGSAAFAGTDTFVDTPREQGADRNTATVSSVTAATDLETADYIFYDYAIGANGTNEHKGVVVGPNSHLIVYASSANVSFQVNGFENTVNDYTSVHYTQADAGGAGGGGGAGAPGAP